MADAEVDKNRATKTFMACTTSIQLMLYNVYFLEHIGRPKGKSLKEVAASYDALFGHASNEMKERFFLFLQDIKNVTDWKYAPLYLLIAGGQLTLLVAKCSSALALRRPRRASSFRGFVSR